MPEVPNKITIDRRRHKVFIDGVEFPWFIAENGPDVEDLANRNAMPIVTIPIIAKDIEVIPEGPDEVIQYGAVGTEHDVTRPRPGESGYRG